MRTNLTTDDVKRLVEYIYNGNLTEYRTKKGTADEIPYVNENSENIVLYDEQGIKLGEKDLAEYLNIHFYTWKNRLESKTPSDDGFDAWVQSLNLSMNEAFGIVEVVDEKAVASQDIDAATVTGRVTLVMQTNKVALLDAYAKKLHNKYVGAPFGYTNNLGKNLVLYLNLGVLLYDEEPSMTQLGSTVVVSFNFTISYMTAASTYDDVEIEFSFDKEHWYKLPLSNAKIQKAMTFSAVPYMQHPDNTGVINTAVSETWAFSYYDFKDNELCAELNRIFYDYGATETREEGQTWERTTIAPFNDPLYAKISVLYPNETKRQEYLYAYTITEMTKQIVNNDFVINAITLRGRSKEQIKYEEIS